jgi:dTDP-4-dehydrorhamnose reductase
MKLLVTGTNGQVGSELVYSLRAIGEVVAFDHPRCDFTRPEQFAGLFERVKPDVVVNAAAYTAVNAAEDEQSLAMMVNGTAVARLAREAKKAGAVLVHYSSDFVFDGSKDGLYTENDAPRPLNVYGHSKLAGENAVRQVGGAYLILRSGWIYSRTRGRNVLRTVLRFLRERRELRFVAGQIGKPASTGERRHLDEILGLLRDRDELRFDAERIGAPTSAAEIAEVTKALIEAALRERSQGRFEPGLYHVTASGMTTWHGFANAIMETALRHGLARHATAPCLVPVGADDGPAMLPRHSRLSGERLRQRYGITLPHWKEGLALCLEDELLALEPA